HRSRSCVPLPTSPPPPTCTTNVPASVYRCPRSHDGYDAPSATGCPPPTPAPSTCSPTPTAPTRPDTCTGAGARATNAPPPSPPASSWHARPDTSTTSPGSTSPTKG